MVEGMRNDKMRVRRERVHEASERGRDVCNMTSALAERSETERDDDFTLEGVAAVTADKVGVFVDSVRRSRWTLSEDSGQEGARTRRGGLWAP